VYRRLRDPVQRGILLYPVVNPVHCSLYTPMVALYQEPGLDVYEAVYYAHFEHVEEVDQILSWYTAKNVNILDAGCSGGLHAIEFARRGFWVTGIDIEPSAVRRAKERSRLAGLNVRFEVLDMETDDLSPLGPFHLIYSIGNVLSHIRKSGIYNVFRKIRTVMAQESVFLFNLFTIEAPFIEVLHENRRRILWTRKLDRRTGSIKMVGNFLDFGISQDFSLWGYYINEVQEMLQVTGFANIEVSESPDFSRSGTHSKNPLSLYFRAAVHQ